jgi:tRNA A-37 threonylcarbamoyl transferase component Bud32
LLSKVKSLHELGIVHGRICPSNVLCDHETGELYLTNFNMADIVGDSEDSACKEELDQLKRDLGVAEEEPAK